MPARDTLIRPGRLGAAIIISCTIAVLYAHTLNVPWYFDDFDAIVSNPVVHD